MNEQNTALVARVLAQGFAGEPLPSFRSPDFATLLQGALEAGLDARACEVIGRACVLLLLDHLQASMTTEREMALLRDASRPC